MSTTTQATSPADDRICYTHCNFCNTVLAVTIPAGHVLFNAVTVRCGHCANLLSLHLGSFLQPLALETHHHLHLQASPHHESQVEWETSLLLRKDGEQLLPIQRPPGKKHRVPSAYNRFIKEEIQRLKACNPNISHKQAFSTAAKNWAHLPSIHIGLNIDNYKERLN